MLTILWPKEGGRWKELSRSGEEEAEGTKYQEVDLCYLTEYAKWELDPIVIRNRFLIQLCHLADIWPWVIHLIFLIFSIFIYKTWIICSPINFIMLKIPSPSISTGTENKFYNFLLSSNYNSCQLLNRQEGIEHKSQAYSFYLLHSVGSRLP